MSIPAYDNSVNEKILRFAHNTISLKVSPVHALGIITDPNLERMYKQGYFKVEPEKEFKAEVEKVFYPVETAVIFDRDSILTFMLKNNRKALKDLIVENPVNRENVIDVARENIENLSQSTIKFLNELLKVELVIEEG